MKFDKDDATILEEAAGYIDAGWCQRSLANGGTVCALGALNKALTGEAAYTEFTSVDQLKRLASAILRKGKIEDRANDILFTLTFYNDLVAKDATEVSDLFRKTAKSLANGE